MFAIIHSQVALVVKNLASDARDVWDAGSIPGWGRSPGGGHGNPLQYSCLENPMDRGAWWPLSLRSCRVRHDWSNLAHTHNIFSIHGCYVLKYFFQCILHTKILELEVQRRIFRIFGIKDSRKGRIVGQHFPNRLYFYFLQWSMNTFR